MSTDLLIRIDPDQPVPPYIQIRDQIADLVGAGELPVGTRLPTVRQFAADLGLANGTVARAYQELEAGGYVITRRGGGTRVAPQPDPASQRRAAIVQQRTREYVDSMRRLGIDAEAALAAVRDAFNER